MGDGPPRRVPAEMATKYAPAEHEERIRDRWTAANAFHAEPGPVLRGEKPPYCVLIPPPNVTAALHLGHALNNTLQDVLARVHRMRGFETLWMPGTDHAGIATQSVVDKRLREQGKPAIRELKQTEGGREAFIEQVQAFKDEYEARITEQLQKIGCSCDWQRQRFTMDPVCARAVREAFFQLFKQGLIYRGKRLVNWDPVTQTALADDEVEMKEVQGKFYYLRYPLVHAPENPDDPKDAQEVTWSELAARGYPGAEDHPDEENAWLTVATTRPETYLGDTAVAVNPEDPRAGALRGLMVQLPIIGRIVPIVEDDYVVMADPESSDAKAKFATGFLKVTPAHDPNDDLIGQRHAERITAVVGETHINVMGPDASISDKHGWDRAARRENGEIFIGKSREDARDLVVREFQARGLLERTRDYTHSVGHSYRSHVPIEPWLSDQWYVKVTDDRLVGEAQRAMVPQQRTTGGPGFQPGRERSESSETGGPASTGGPGFQPGHERSESSETGGPASTGGPGFQPGHERSESSKTGGPASTGGPGFQPGHERSESLKTGGPASTGGPGFQPGHERSESLKTGGPGFQPGRPTSARSPTLSSLSKRQRTLPHWERGGSTYFITFRVAEGELSESERRIALDACLYWHGKKMRVFVATVMPDHVHLLAKPLETGPGQWHSLPEIMHSIKGFSANEINRARGTIGALWQDEYYDRIMRDEEEAREKWKYIWDNPLKWKLVEDPKDYPFTVQPEWPVSDGASGESPGLKARATGASAAAQRDPGDGALTFHPARYARTYESWHDNLRDWCISRQLWWGHRIPVWVLSLADNADDPTPAGDADRQQAIAAISVFLGVAGVAADVFLQERRLETHVELVACARTERAAQALDQLASAEWNFIQSEEGRQSFTAKHQHGKELADAQRWIEIGRQDPDVLDTWFSSALWPLSTMGWPDPEHPPREPAPEPRAIDPSGGVSIQSVWTRRVGTWRNFIGAAGERSGELIDTLLVLRDKETNPPLIYKLFSESDLRRPLEKAEDIQSAEDLLVAVGLRIEGEAETRNFGRIHLPDFLAGHGFRKASGRSEFSGLLEAFNPTDVLCTARDIITLWVSRMVMFNRFFRAEATERRSDEATEGARERDSERAREGQEVASASTLDPRPSTLDPSGSGPVPFRDVYIHPVIQDGYGQRMSKSLGNGVDPLDIVHSHGADAMRFVLCGLATATQDVRMPVDVVCPHCAHVFQPGTVTTPAGHTVMAPELACPNCSKLMVSGYGMASGKAAPRPDRPLARNTSSRFDDGQKFCNKLWNASRFAIGILDRARGTGESLPDTIDPSSLPLADRWMLSRLARAMRDIDGAIGGYEFATYAQHLYDLLWRDFCDWYLESTKPTIEQSPAQAASLRAILDAVLRLLHPVVPFVTEAVDEQLRQFHAAPIQGLTLPPSPPRADGLLCRAGWPGAGESLVDESAEAAYERLKTLVTEIREVRAQQKVQPRRKITLHLPQDLIDEFESSGSTVLIQTLAGVETITAAEPEGASAEFTFESRTLRVSDLAEALNPTAERERLEKQVGELEKSLAALDKRLSNPGYTDKAPAHLVEQTRQQHARVREELTTAQQALERLQ